MFPGQEGTDLILVIIILEVLLLVQSIALAIQSDRKIVKIVNSLTAIFWLICIIYNALNFGLLG